MQRRPELRLRPGMCGTSATSREYEPCYNGGELCLRWQQPSSTAVFAGVIPSTGPAFTPAQELAPDADVGAEAEREVPV
jgi:hypothetical protein